MPLLGVRGKGAGRRLPCLPGRGRSRPDPERRIERRRSGLIVTGARYRPAPVAGNLVADLWRTRSSGNSRRRGSAAGPGFDAETDPWRSPRRSLHRRRAVSGHRSSDRFHDFPCEREPGNRDEKSLGQIYLLDGPLLDAPRRQSGGGRVLDLSAEVRSAARRTSTGVRKALGAKRLWAPVRVRSPWWPTPNQVTEADHVLELRMRRT